MKQETSMHATTGLLRAIMRAEFEGVVLYTHYSGCIVGLHAQSFSGWFQQQARESLDHALLANTHMTYHCCAHTSLDSSAKDCPALEMSISMKEKTHPHDIYAMLERSRAQEEAAIALYQELLTLVQGQSVVLEEYAREMIVEETKHTHEINKFLQKP